MYKRQPPLLAAVLILLLATGLRFHRLDAQSFWNDEGNSARLSERAIPAILEGTASDIHPPLYYLLLHGWRALLGDSEFALRALSAFAGVLTVATVAALAKRRGAGGPGSRGERLPPAPLRQQPATYMRMAATLFAATAPVPVSYTHLAHRLETLSLRHQWHYQ